MPPKPLARQSLWSASFFYAMNPASNLCYTIYMYYAFVLGNHPKLSIKEIEAVTGHSAQQSSNEIAIFDLPDNTDTSILQLRLAGTVKIIKIVTTEIFTGKDALLPMLADLIELPEPGNKFPFGLSIYALSVGPSAVLAKQSMQIGLSLKKGLKGEGQNIRLVTSRNTQLSAVDVDKNYLLSKGVELIVITDGKQVHLGKTISIQPYEYWAKTDMARPRRDMRRGMLPPKLARVLVNISGIKSTETLLDPFCGTGTVLEEAALVGVQNIIGADIDPKAIEDSKVNFQFRAPNNTLPELFAAAAKNIPAQLQDRLVDAIVCEPFMGEPRQGNETLARIKDEVAKLASLYKESFGGLAKVLKPGGKIVVTLPVHFVGTEPVVSTFADDFDKMGFKRVWHELYKHPGQFVARDITIFQKQ